MFLILKAVGVSAPLGLVTILLEVDFSNTITTGALFTSLIVIVVAGFFSVRANSAKIWRDNFEAEKARADALDEQVKEALVVISEQKQIITRLEALPNLERVIRLMTESTERTDRRADERLVQALELLRALFATHEARAEARHDQLIEEVRHGRQPSS